MNRSKKLTAVVAALDTFAEIRDALYWLHRQTARDQLEIMVVCQDLALFDLPEDAQQQMGPLRFVESGIGNRENARGSTSDRLPRGQHPVRWVLRGSLLS